MAHAQRSQQTCVNSETGVDRLQDLHVIPVAKDCHTLAILLGVNALVAYTCTRCIGVI